MRIRSVSGLHASAATHDLPCVDLVLARPRTQGPRSIEVQLAQAVHVPEARLVILRLKAVPTAGDGFQAADGGSELHRRISLAHLKGRNLSGYRILVRDMADRDLATGAWPEPTSS